MTKFIADMGIDGDSLTVCLAVIVYAMLLIFTVLYVRHGLKYQQRVYGVYISQLASAPISTAPISSDISTPDTSPDTENPFPDRQPTYIPPRSVE